MAINPKDVEWSNASDTSNIQWDEPILAPTVEVKAKEKPVEYSAPKETARSALEGLSLGFASELEAALRSGCISGALYQNLIKQLERNKSKTILIVDDSFVVREQLKDIFSNRNYNTLEAKNAKEALEIVSLNKVDLMLLDLELEESNGYDFLIKNFLRIQLKVLQRLCIY